MNKNRCVGTIYMTETKNILPRNIKGDLNKQTYITCLDNKTQNFH